jgi:hypothetical protein
MALRRRLAALTAAAALLLTGCAAPEREVGEAVSIPATPAGEQFEWVLRTMNADVEPSEGDVAGRFTDDFLAQATPADLVGIFTSFQEQAPWTATSFEGGETQALADVESPDADPLQVQIAVDSSGVISGLLFTPPPPPRDPADSWEGIDEDVTELADGTSLVVTDLDSGDERLALGPDEAKPMGSVFKLWVLAAVVDAVAAGELAWDDTVTVTDDLKSLPSGRLQDEDAGYETSVRDAAGLMISISDNTATDLLIDVMGRERVEAVLDELGVDGNRPFPTTREFFQLGWDSSAEERSTYADGSREQRLEQLEALGGGELDIPAAAVTEPRWQEGIDWFGTPGDLRAVQEALQERADTDAGEPVRDILGENSGLDFGDEWTSVAFKGGSAPGVLAGSWYLEGEAGRFTISLQAASDDPALVQEVGAYFGTVEDAARLLAQE